MNDLTKGTTMQNSLWTRENDWTKVQIFDTVRLTNEDGAEVTIVVSSRCPSARPFAPWVESTKGFTYYERDWRLFVQVPLRPVLPTVPGTVIRAKGTGISAMLGYVADEWFFIGGNRPLTDLELRENFEHGFDVLEPVAETAKKVLDRVDGWYALGETRTLTKYLAAIAAEFGVTS